ncbi:MAG: tetratricopeptide repeat protein [Terriglobales bacterium]
MKLHRVAAFFAPIVCFSLFAFTQTSPAPQSSGQPSSSGESSQDKAAGSAQQQPASEQPPTEQKKKDSKVKRKAKELIPGCVGISGGAGKCRHSQDEEEQAKKEAAEQDLRRQCREAADLSQPESPSCADLRKRDATHDIEVGDTYFDQKSYIAAGSRYHSALQGDPTNATAMLHYAQALEKLGRKSEAYEQYQNYLKTDPPADDAQRARAAMDRLRSQVSPTSK